MLAKYHYTIEENQLFCHAFLHSVLFKADQQCPLYISFFQISTLSTVELVQNANWRQ